jgi:plasmid stabilization system protein ParE
MNGKTYKLRYLPLFEVDLAAARDYITETLMNPIAANRLVIDTETAILKRLETPLAFSPYPTKRKRPQPYYYIQIRNFFVMYVVIDNVMEVRRFVYNRRNIDALL